MVANANHYLSQVQLCFWFSPMKKCSLSNANYVMTCVSEIREFGCSFSCLFYHFSLIKLTTNDLTEILFKVSLNTHNLSTRAIVTWQYNHVYTVLIVLKIQWNHLKVGFVFIVFVSLYWQYSLILESNCFTNISMKCLKELYRDILLTEINVFILSKYYWNMMNCSRLYLKTI